ncbi:ATP binding protein [Salix suchowensis]|nr:ATP binding protein [Salix suchowensis]
MVAQLEHHHQQDSPAASFSSSPEDHVQKTKSLISALNFVSRNLPLPPELFNTVSSIYSDVDNADFDGGAQERSQLLAELQNKVRSEVSSEYWLRFNCMFPDKQLFDWGMMRLPRPLYGIGDAFSMEADDQFRKKRDAERLSRIEEEERNHVETRKRKFFAEILNAVREFQLQLQATLKRRKQRNDGIQAWHGRQRQRATRAEKLRLQALKADDQEAYMSRGQAPKRCKHSDGIEPIRDSEADSPELDASRIESPLDTDPEEDVIIDSNLNDDTGDLLEGQRQYNSAIHSIQEKEEKFLNCQNMIRVQNRWIKAFLYDGRLEERKAIREQLSREGNLQVLITHYDLIMRDKAFLKKIQWQYMIVDEGHRLKNHECALAKTIAGYQVKRRLLLTGTPIEQLAGTLVLA